MIRWDIKGDCEENKKKERQRQNQTKRFKERMEEKRERGTNTSGGEKRRGFLGKREKTRRKNEIKGGNDRSDVGK